VEQDYDELMKKKRGDLNNVRNVIDILEEWLDIHPFPKQKHTAKYIKDQLKV